MLVYLNLSISNILNNQNNNKNLVAPYKTSSKFDATFLYLVEKSYSKICMISIKLNMPKKSRVGYYFCTFGL